MNNMFGFSSSAKDISALMRSPAVGQNLMRNSISSPSVGDNLIKGTKKRPFNQVSSILDLEEESQLDDKMERKGQPKSSPYFFGDSPRDSPQQFRKPTFAQNAHSFISGQGDIRSSPKPPPPPAVDSTNFDDNKEAADEETILDVDDGISSKNFQTQEADEEDIYFANTQQQQSEVQEDNGNVSILENEMQQLLQVFQDIQEKEKAFVAAKTELMKQKVKCIGTVQFLTCVWQNLKGFGSLF